MHKDEQGRTMSFFGDLHPDFAGNVVKAHPVATGAAVAAIGLALYAGNRISKAEIDLGHDLGVAPTDVLDGLNHQAYLVVVISLVGGKNFDLLNKGSSD
jgi:hypothetical protein